MDIFVEPVVPLPELTVYGSGPVAMALAQISRAFGFTLTICGNVEAGEVDADRHFVSPNELDKQSHTNADHYVVVATQGTGDVAALTSALAASRAYVAFVGSRRKFGAYAGKLRDAGINETSLALVRSPAGIHINAVTPEEIALSIMAEIVQTRRAARVTRTADG
jgi:xanthine dehydrogenase accessory factor